MRTLGILFGSLVVLATVARADDAIPPGTVREIKAATVFVKVKVEGGSCSGSGFVVKADGADAFVVTNHHVIEPKLVEVLLAPSRRPSAPMPGRDIPSARVRTAPRLLLHCWRRATRRG